jgi:phosphatidylglycerophosphate synthase
MKRKRQRMPPGNRHWRVADTLTWLRLVLLPVLWVPALAGEGGIVGMGLIAAGVTDFLDGYIARTLGQASAAGARLDSIADTLLLVSAAAWIEVLHPEIASDNSTVIGATFVVYGASLAVGFIKFGKVGNLHLYSSRIAGGLLYTFAVFTLLTGVYEPLLLTLAAAALILSSVETVVAQLVLGAVDERLGSVLLVRRRRAETSTIQVIGTARKQRSQAPHSAKVVGNNASPPSSSPTAAAPRPNDTAP